VPKFGWGEIPIAKRRLITMHPHIKSLWVAALRSGEYKQAQGALRTPDGMCCLGVLCDLHSKETETAWAREDGGDVDDCYDGETALLPASVLEWAGLYGQLGDSKNHPVVSVDGKLVGLADLNDGAGRRKHTFPEIADLIERHL
jgi:hypothetical protein